MDRVVFLYLALLLLACTAITYPPETPTNGCVQYIRAELDPKFRASDVADIFEASHLWSDASHGYMCLTLEQAGPPDVIIHRAATNVDLEPVDPNWKTHAGITLGRHIYIVTDDFGELMITAIATHEFGHFFGLHYGPDASTHSLSDLSIMRSTINPDVIAKGVLPDMDAAAYCAVQICRKK